MSERRLDLYTCTDHDGFWPVGVASIVFAETISEARELLEKALNEHGLNGKEPFTLNLVVPTKGVVILRDGEY